jgi:hypothetical protein
MKSAPIMAYRVDLTERAARNLRRIYLTINAEDAAQATVLHRGETRRDVGAMPPDRSVI